MAKILARTILLLFSFSALVPVLVARNARFDGTPVSTMWYDNVPVSEIIYNCGSNNSWPTQKTWDTWGYYSCPNLSGYGQYDRDDFTVGPASGECESTTNYCGPVFDSPDTGRIGHPEWREYFSQNTRNRWQELIIFDYYCFTESQSTTWMRKIPVKWSSDAECGFDDDADGYGESEDACNDEPQWHTEEDCCEQVHEGYTWFEGVCTDASPLIIPAEGDPSLTTAQGGVLFDLNVDGVKERISWTRPGSRTAWLVLDRNGNGQIDNGTELFSTFAPQPRSKSRNGFEALRMFDSPQLGGNGDGWIDAADAVFTRLQLWTDTNHDGSATGELKSAQSSGVRRISLDYRSASRIDRGDNLWKLRSRLVGDPNSPWVWDVFLKVYKGS